MTGHISKSNNGEHLLVKMAWQDGVYNMLRDIGFKYKDGFMILNNDKDNLHEIVNNIINQFKYTITDEAKAICDLAKKQNEEKSVKNKEAEKIKNDFSIEIDHGLKIEPYPYQKAGIAFLDKVDGIALLTDEMGLGKSMQAIGYAHRNKLKTLVICPATLKLMWQDEIIKFTGDDSFIIDSQTELKDIINVQYYIINYDILAKQESLINNLNCELLIADESHYIKNWRAIRTKATHRIKKYFNHKILLTGTPVLNKPIELYSQLNVIQPNKWGTFMQFAINYCNAKKGRFGWDFNGVSNIEKLKEKLAPIMIRREKKDVLKELPDKIYQTINVEMSKDIKKQYNLAINDFQEFLKEKGYDGERIDKAMNAQSLVLINELKQLVINDKIKTLLEMIEGFNGDKAVIFCDYIKPIEALKEKFGNLCVILTGAVSKEDRKIAVDRFQNDKNIKYFIGTTKAAGVGITLTAANKVFFLSLPWTPADMSKAADRCHRIGQKDTVNIYCLSCGEIDQYISELLLAKSEIIGQVVGSEVVNIREKLIKKLAKNLKNSI